MTGAASPGIPYLRVSGAGNDFLALVQAGPEPGLEPSPAEIRSWCRRGVGLGADGLFQLRPGAPGTVVMVHFNADGSEAALCVNGTRCAARLAFELGWATQRVVVETGAGAFVAVDRGDSIELEVPIPSGPATALDLGDILGTNAPSYFLMVGVPHVVIEWPESLLDAPVERLGAAIRWSPQVAPAGANVNFVRFVDPSRLEIRTFERGVEAETLACGSGILASTAVGWALGCLGERLEVTTSGGFPFRVEGIARAGKIERWSLAGDARLVARGEILAGAAVAVVPPQWSGSGVSPGRPL